ncbi:MAG: transcription antitermination factor NusB [Gemmatimonadaceae bacterium]|nr:transcription antitermination factor NusB [Gemmatimonadaceae bacterium]
MDPRLRPPLRRGWRLIAESRIAAAEILASLRGGTLLDGAFERVGHRARPRAIRRWVQELVYGLLRSRGWIDAILAPRITGGLARLDADLGDLLRLGAYQLLSMGSVPAYAAIAQTVELAKRRHGIGASKLVNAVLRRIDRERDLPSVATPDGTAAALDRNHDLTERLVIRTSHPRLACSSAGSPHGAGPPPSGSRRTTTAKRRSSCDRSASAVMTCRPCCTSASVDTLTGPTAG